MLHIFLKHSQAFAVFYQNYIKMPSCQANMIYKNSQGEVKMPETQSNLQGFRAVRWKSDQFKICSCQQLKSNEEITDVVIAPVLMPASTSFLTEWCREASARRKLPLVLISLKYQNSSSVSFSSPATQEGGKAFKSAQSMDYYIHWNIGKL